MRDLAVGWIILRCSGPRTLKLAASLNEAGVEAWTPVGRVRRRFKGSDKRPDVDAPILPTFVFARSTWTARLLGMASANERVTPAFSVFHDRERIPVIADGSLSPLRRVEDAQRKRVLKEQVRTARAGATVLMEQGIFTGLSGTVVSATGKAAEVDFGGGFVVQVASYLLPDDVLQAAPIAA